MTGTELARIVVDRLLGADRPHRADESLVATLQGDEVNVYLVDGDEPVQRFRLIVEEEDVLGPGCSCHLGIWGLLPNPADLADHLTRHQHKE